MGYFKCYNYRLARLALAWFPSAGPRARNSFLILIADLQTANASSEHIFDSISEDGPNFDPAELYLVRW